jgi:hypothetical protein
MTIQAIYFPETSADFKRTSWRYIPADINVLGSQLCGPQTRSDTNKNSPAVTRIAQIAAYYGLFLINYSNIIFNVKEENKGREGKCLSGCHLDNSKKRETN